MTLAQSHAGSGGSPAPNSGASLRMLVKITVSGNLKIPLDKEIVTIGRRITSDICIRSRYLSRSHARIINLPTGAVIEDLNSHNGVFVNTQRIRYRHLCSGDLIDLGGCQLRYIDLCEHVSDEGHA